MLQDIKRNIIYFLPVIFWLMLIIILPLLIMGNLNTSVKYIDKVVHFIEYGILGFLFSRAFYSTYKEKDLVRAHLLAIGIAVFIAAFDEMYQIYFPNRTASLFDFLADVSGILISQIMFRVLILKYKTAK